MPASDARKRSRRVSDRARPKTARVDASDGANAAREDSEDELELAGGDAYGALLASLGANVARESDEDEDASSSDASERSGSETTTSSASDGEDEDSPPADARAGGSARASGAASDSSESDDESDARGEESDDGDDDDDAADDTSASAGEKLEEGGGMDEDEGALARHLRVGETLADAEAEALKTQRVSFPKTSAESVGKKGAWEGANGLEPPKTLDVPRFVNAKLRERWRTVTGSEGFASEDQARLYSMLAAYVDVQHGNRMLIPDQGPAGQQLNDETLDAVCLHVIDHVTRTRNRVMKNNESLAKKAKAGVKVIEDDLPRDQGFVRPTVLFLTPMRNIAGRAIMRLLELCPAAHGRNDAVNKLERIEEDFLAYDGSDSEDEVEDEHGNKKKKYKPFVPDDHKALFKGNTDDHFRLGLKLTKASVRLYVDFFGADIIFASPLGIVTALQDEKSAADFLSAIEILVIDHAHVIQMQNWAHVATLVDAMNALPKDTRDCDIQRVHESHLNGHARHLRQTILLSAFQTPEINALFNRRCVNFEGKVRFRAPQRGVLGKLAVKTRQQFERVAMKASDVVDADDIRFKYFTKKVLPRIRENPEPGVVIFVSSYFDFVRVRNLLVAEDVSFAVNSEYTEPREAARARTLFADGRKRVLLLSERAHFYFRRRIKGAREICFYSLPEHRDFYPELVSYLAGSSAAASARATDAVAGAPVVGHVAGVVALFSKLDALKLERIVGCARARKMIDDDERPMFLFV